MGGNRPSAELMSRDDDAEGHMACNAKWMTAQFRDFRLAQDDEAQGNGGNKKFGKKSATKHKKADLSAVDPNLAQQLSQFNRIDWKDYSDLIPERAWQMLVRFSREPMHINAPRKPHPFMNCWGIYIRDPSLSWGRRAKVKSSRGDHSPNPLAPASRKRTYIKDHSELRATH